MKACPRKEQLAVAAVAMGCKATTVVAMREELHVALGFVEVVGSSDEDEQQQGGGKDSRGDTSGKRGGDAGSDVNLGRWLGVVARGQLRHFLNAQFCVLLAPFVHGAPHG